MKYIVPLMVLTRCLLIECDLEWKVLETVTDYGQNVTLFCNVSNCCPKLSGWDKYSPAQHTIFIDVKTGKPTKKYDGKVLTNGYTLVIQNLSKQDLNISYACVYGSSLGEQQYLLEDNVFDYISTTQQNGPIDNRNFPAGKIAGIIIGAFVAVLVVFFVFCFWNRRREIQRSTRNRIEGSNKEVALISTFSTDTFLEEPNDIYCIEGEDAILKCQLPPDIPPVKWLTNGREIINNDKYIISMDDTQHKLTIKNTTESDSGEYYVQVGEFSKKIQLNITEIPREINMNERKTYMDATKSGIETRQYVRIQVIGRDRVGKTSLVRRLLFPEDGEYDGKSTDGIEINRKCQIRRNDGKWFVGDVDTHKKEQSETVSKQTCQRVSKEYVLETETKQKEQIPTISKEYLLDIKKKQHDHEPLLSYEKDIGTHKVEVVTKINLAATTINANDNTLHKADKQTHDDFTNPELIDTHVMPADQTTEMMNQKLDEIMSRAKKCTAKGTKASNDLVECGIWDFAGQQDYYATHQTFFTPHAIYLLVADIEDNIKPLTQNEDDCYCIDDYIDFWFDNIHCFCDNHSAEKLCPPVITVFTGTDKFEKAEDKEIYADKLLVYFGKDNKFNHNRGIYFISNTQFKEEDSKEIKILRKHISNIALEMGYFAETLPKKWIQLESAVEVLKDLSIYVYSWYDMKKLAQKYSLEEKELLLFLNYKHKIGNVIFFKEISEYIILQPNWLVKCFRCLVCDSNHEKRNFNLICPTAWNKLKNSGELSDILISQLFQKEPELKFGDHKTYLLNIMEKFDVVIKPKFRDISIDKCYKSDSYFLPCMIEKSSSYEDILDTFISKSSDVFITPWLVFEFEFLPFAYFNHILFHYIRNYEVCKVKGLYRGKAVFYLAELSKFIICFSHNAVSVQIWRWHDVLDDNVYQTFLNELCDIIEAIQGKFRHTISYSIKFKCSTGDYSESSYRTPLKNYEHISEVYLCNEHSCTHSMDDLWNSWLKHYDRYYKKPGQKGLALIVNLMFCGTGSGRQHRQDSLMDVQNLSNFFNNEIKYQVECTTHDMTKIELQNYFKKIARTYLKQNSKDYHSFICVIMSHRIKDGIKTRDTHITIEEIKQIFKFKRGGKFNSKPKIFLIQSISGPQYYHDQTGKQVNSFAASTVKSDVQSVPSENEPTDVDILVAWLSKSDFYSLNAEIDFVNVFITVAKTTHRDKHIEDILKEVKKQIVKYRRYGGYDISLLESTLTRKFFL